MSGEAAVGWHGGGSAGVGWHQGRIRVASGWLGVAVGWQVVVARGAGREMITVHYGETLCVAARGSTRLRPGAACTTALGHACRYRLSEFRSTFRRSEFPHS